jgi:hypothetical protein
MAMKISEKGLALLKNYEELRLDAHDVEGRGKLLIIKQNYSAMVAAFMMDLQNSMHSLIAITIM